MAGCRVRCAVRRWAAHRTSPNPSVGKLCRSRWSWKAQRYRFNPACGKNQLYGKDGETDCQPPPVPMGASTSFDLPPRQILAPSIGQTQ